MATSPHIVALRHRPSGRPATPDRVRIHLDDGTELDAALEVVERLGLCSGDPVDALLRVELADADLRWRAREAALGLLSHRSRTRTELEERLARKGFPRDATAACLARLADEGLVDDPAFARALVRDRIRLRPRSRRALRMELRHRGVDEATARAAVDEVFQAEERDDEGLAREVAATWLRKQPPHVRRDLLAPRFSEARQRARRRFLGHLGRRGFTGATARTALDAVLTRTERSETSR